jgi:hypothetical protein
MEKYLNQILLNQRLLLLDFSNKCRRSDNEQDKTFIEGIDIEINETTGCIEELERKLK